MLAQRAPLRPVRSRGVQQGDVPADASECFFMNRVPQQFHQFYFKVQNAWKSDQQLERDMIRMWQEMYPDETLSYAMRSHP